MRVLCLVPYPTLGASNRLRVEQYAPHLRPLGISLTVSRFLDESGYAVIYRRGSFGAKALSIAHGLFRRVGDLRRAQQFDLVLVHREASLIGPPIIERLLGRLGVPYAYDFDDAIFKVAPYAVNRRWNKLLRPPSRIEEIARRACLVITQNDYLARWARQHNENVEVIPTPVDTDRHRPDPAPHRADPLVIGWVGSPTTAPYLSLLDGPLAEIGRRRRIIVRVIGGAYRHASVPVECLPYDLAREPEQVAAFDIGLLPEPDDEWTRGKGAFKALLYMAAAVPVVASDVGVNANVIGGGGFTVRDETGWIDPLERLAEDAELRREKGAAGRARAEQLYSVKVVAPRFAAALRRGVELASAVRA